LSEWLIVIFDVVACITFTAAFVVVVSVPADEYQPYTRVIRLFLALAIAVYMFVSVSNVLEHAGITAALDPYEDYSEILFVPLIAYGLFTINTARQVNETRRAFELVRAEHSLLTAIVDTSPGGIMLVASSGDVAFANDRAKELLGIQADVETGSLRLPSNLICTSTVSVSSRPLDLQRLAAGEEFDSAVCIVEVDARRVALSVSASPLPSPDGSAQGSVVAFVDVTEREQARQDLLDAQARYSLDLERTVDERTVDLFALNRELERANRAKQEFLARANHELRTPLSAIVGFTGLLLSEKSGSINAEQRTQVVMVQSSAEQLLGLVDRTLDMGRVKSGHNVTESVNTDIATLLIEIANLVRPLAANREVTLDVDVPPNLVVRTDPDLLGQIIRNLLSNAIKFTDAGGTVTLRGAVDADSVFISVADTGIGIPVAEQEHVFEAFIQIPAAQTGRPKGTGLGLAICRDLAGVLGGSVRLESVPGEGSVFIVELPMGARSV